jgi:hypothetical protein
MAQINDYASLVSAVADYYDRASDTAFMGRMDTFIGLAEDSWTPTLINRRMEVSVPLTTAADGTVALPDDFIRLRGQFGAINGVNTNLPQVGPVAAQGLYPIPSGLTPKFGQIVGNTLSVLPGQVQTFTLDYWAKPTGLSGSTATNWIILTAPTLYFYSTMSQASLWLKAFDEASSWDSLADIQLDAICNKFGLDYYSNTDLVLDTPTP